MTQPTLEDWEQWAEEDAKARQHIVDMLADLREKQGLSQRDLAKAMAVSQPLICGIEKGRFGRLSTLQRYARALGGRLAVYIDMDPQ